MFSPRTLRIVENSFRFCKLIKLFPLAFNFDMQSGALTYKPIVPKNMSNALVLTIYSFLIYLLIQGYLRLSHKLPFTVMEMYWISVYFVGHNLAGDGLLSALRKKKEMVTYFKRILQFDHDMDDLIKVDRKGSHNIKEKTEKVAYYICKCHVGLVGTFVPILLLIYLMKPTAPQHIYHIAFSQGYNGPLVESAFFVFEAVFKTWCVVGAMVLNAWFLVSVQFETYVMLLIQNLQLNIPQKVELYRRLYVLNYMHNHTYIVTLLPLRLISFGLFTIAGTFVLVRQLDRINIFEKLLVSEMLVAFLLLAVVFIHISGSVFKKTLELKRMLKSGMERRLRRREDKIDIRLIRTMRPFGVRLGPIKAMSYVALQMFLTTVANGITTALVGSGRR